MHSERLIHRRGILLAAGAALSLSGTQARAAAAPLSIVVHKDPSCGCCDAWVDHLKSAGFNTEIRESADIGALKRRLGVPDDLASCHTGVVNGYAIEGHVPAADIRRLVASGSKARGLAVPGMPVNSPGMEVPGEANERYTVWLFQADGKRAAFAQHGG
ncbi:MAG: DUF411 domain-containing protein [Alphaproteobacteria bacterium]|nr:DUF411 domain-containing protein [Alphaproteobacteria bacterium]